MLLSVVIPVYDEEQSVPLILSELRYVLAQMDCDYEIIFVNDGSLDGTVEILARESLSDWRIKVLEFTRNFGQQAAITAGLDCAEGDAVVVMDADLQDPPGLLPEMVRLFEEGYEIVSVQRVLRTNDTWLKRATAALFYGLMRRMVDRRRVPEVGDFRLFSRSAVLALRQFREQHRFMRGLVAWLGLREAVLPFQRPARAAGVTKYPLSRMLRFAWTAIVSSSALPLRMSVAFGTVLSFAGFGYLLYTLYVALITHSVVPGWSSIVALQCIFSGVTLLALGLIGDYIARIYEESKQRPLYVVRHAQNLSVAPPQINRAVVIPAPAPQPLVSDRVASS